jgi:hypothetical protein
MEVTTNVSEKSRKEKESRQEICQAVEEESGKEKSRKESCQEARKKGSKEKSCGKEETGCKESSGTETPVDGSTYSKYLHRS